MCLCVCTSTTMCGVYMHFTVHQVESIHFFDSTWTKKSPFSPYILILKDVPQRCVKNNQIIQLCTSRSPNCYLTQHTINNAILSSCDKITVLTGTDFQSYLQVFERKYFTNLHSIYTNKMKFANSFYIYQSSKLHLFTQQQVHSENLPFKMYIFLYMFSSINIRN